MYVTISVFILIVSFLMMLIVLVQKSKGGGLASNFASSNQILGVRQTTDFLEKATWTMAVALVVLCLVSSLVIPKDNGNNSGIDTSMREKVDQLVLPDTQAPAADAATMPIENAGE